MKITRLWQIFQTVLGVIFRHPVPGTTIVPVLPDGRIILIQNRDSKKWGLPGGLVNWGEDIATAARREMAEETGLELVKIRRLIGVYSSPDRDPRLHSICVVLEAEVQGNIHIQDSLEVADVQAFSIDSLPFGQLFHDHDRQLKDYLSGQTILA